MSFGQAALHAFEPGEYPDCTAANANPDHWTWNPREAGWTEAAAPWQDFSHKWYGNTDSPTTPSLSLEPLVSIGEFPPLILVRDCYVRMFKRVWGLAMKSGGKLGTIITGQPGTGKSLLQFYLLVQLLQRKQIVLFTVNGNRLYLFYHGEVYTTFITGLLLVQPEFQLPQPKRPDVFFWSLFDIEAQKEPDSLLFSPPCLPIQTASPNPLRFQAWDKRRSPMHAGLPLWTRDELAKGLQYQLMYPSFVEALGEACGGPQSETDPLLLFIGARELLDEFRKDFASPSVEQAVDHLLGEAIERFGYSARDVFNAVFRYRSATESHQKAFGITFEALTNAVSALIEDRSTSDVSHRILALSPICSQPYGNDKWEVNFKSEWVAKSIIQALQVAEEKEIRQQYGRLQHIPPAGAMAGYFLEPLAHRAISKAKGTWLIYGMKTDGDPNSPQFVVKDDPITIERLKVERKIVPFDPDLPNELESNIYYIPKIPNFPLLDAFTVDFDSETSVILSIFQITTSRSHGGSALGYQRIRGIIAKLKKRLQGEEPPTKRQKTDDGQSDSRPSVKVRFFLVVPEDSSKGFKWQFPKGWKENCQKNDHRGPVYCLQIPFSSETHQ